MTTSWRVTAGNSGVPRAGGHGERGGLTGGCRCLPMLLCPCADPAPQRVRSAPRGLQRSTPGTASRAREKTSGWHPPPPSGNGAVSPWSDLTSSRASVSGTRRLPLLPLLLPLPLPLLGGRRRPPGGEWGRAPPPRPRRGQGRGRLARRGAVARREGAARGESTLGGGEGVLGSGCIPGGGLRPAAGPGGLSVPPSVGALPACAVPGLAAAMSRHGGWWLSGQLSPPAFLPPGPAHPGGGWSLSNGASLPAPPRPVRLRSLQWSSAAG